MLSPSFPLAFFTQNTYDNSEGFSQNRFSIGSSESTNRSEAVFCLTDLVPTLKTDPPIEYHTSRAALLAAQNTTFFAKIHSKFLLSDAFNMRYIMHTIIQYSDKIASLSTGLTTTNYP
jgi:hypothetical protein